MALGLCLSARAWAIAAFCAGPMFAALAQSTSPAAGTATVPAASAPSTQQGSAGDGMSGTAAWYGRKFNGRRTASGQRFNADAMTAAHRSLPFGSRVKVTNIKNNRSVMVVINDRGPTSPTRIIDVSQAAASRLGFTRSGTTEVTLEVVGKPVP